MAHVVPRSDIEMYCLPRVFAWHQQIPGLITGQLSPGARVCVCVSVCVWQSESRQWSKGKDKKTTITYLEFQKRLK